MGTDASSATLHAAREALKRGDTDTAEARCREALAAHADDAAAWTLLGIILRQRDPEAAKNALRRAMDLDKRNPEARFHLGNLYREQSHFIDAVTAYEEALLLAPGHPSLLNNLALALEGAGSVERAITNYQT